MNDQHPTPPIRRTVAVWAAFLVILAVAIWLRVSIADRESVWRDEAQTVAIASQSFPSGILEALRHDGNSPLFYLCEHFFVGERSSPHRELQDRVLSVTLGLILIPLAFAVAWRMTDGSAAAAIAGAAAVAFSPVLVDLSTQARPYAGVALATAAMAFAFVRLERSGRGWIAYAIGAVVGFYLHALFATTIAAFAVGTLVTALRRNSLRQWLLVHSALFVALCPGLIFLHQQVQTLTMAGGRIPWGTTPTFARLLNQVSIMLTGNGGGPPSLAVVAIALVLAALAIIDNARARRLLFVAGLSLSFSFLLAFRSGGFETRYHTAPLTLALIGVAAGAATITSRFRSAGVALAAGAIAIVGAANVNATLSTSRPPRSSARQVASVLGRATRSDAIVIVPDTVAVAVNYYLPAGNKQIDLPADGRVDMIDFRGWTERLSDPRRTTTLDNFVRTQALQKHRVWLVIWQPMLGPLPALSPRDTARSALPAQWALGRSAISSIAGHYRPGATASLAGSSEPMTVILCEPAGRVAPATTGVN